MKYILFQLKDLLGLLLKIKILEYGKCITVHFIMWQVSGRLSNKRIKNFVTILFPASNFIILETDETFLLLFVLTHYYLYLQLLFVLYYIINILSNMHLLLAKINKTLSSYSAMK